MKTLTIAVGAIICLAGLAILLFPAPIVWLAARPLTTPQLYASGLIRIALGVLFVWVASTARVPWLMRTLGGISFLAGIGTLFLGLQRASAIAAWIAATTFTTLRLLGLIPLILGALVIYACGPARRAA